MHPRAHSGVGCGAGGTPPASVPGRAEGCWAGTEPAPWQVGERCWWVRGEMVVVASPQRRSWPAPGVLPLPCHTARLGAVRWKRGQGVEVLGCWGQPVWHSKETHEGMAVLQPVGKGTPKTEVSPACFSPARLQEPENCSPGQAAPSLGQPKQQPSVQQGWRVSTQPGSPGDVQEPGQHPRDRTQPSSMHRPRRMPPCVPCSVQLCHPWTEGTQDPKHRVTARCCCKVVHVCLGTNGDHPCPQRGDRLGHLHHASPHPSCRASLLTMHPPHHTSLLTMHPPQRASLMPCIPLAIHPPRWASPSPYIPLAGHPSHWASPSPCILHAVHHPRRASPSPYIPLSVHPPRSEPANTEGRDARPSLSHSKRGVRISGSIFGALGS